MHVVLSGRGIEIVVHAIPRAIARGIAIAKPPRVREETPLKPAFTVRSLDAVRNAGLEPEWQDEGLMGRGLLLGTRGA